ncbi:MAG: hypothetical protein ACJAYB_001400 [Psychromonas sp.]|jgi:hypothetical protein
MLGAQYQLVTALFYKVPIELMNAVNNQVNGGNMSLISDFRRKSFSH